jgi:hypothetical protein
MLLNWLLKLGTMQLQAKRFLLNSSLLGEDTVRYVQGSGYDVFNHDCYCCLFLFVSSLFGGSGHFTTVPYYDGLIRSTFYSYWIVFRSFPFRLLKMTLLRGGRVIPLSLPFYHLILLGNDYATTRIWITINVINGVSDHSPFIFCLPLLS